MPREVIIRPRAMREAKNSIALYDSRTPGLGRALHDEIFAVIDEICEKPDRFAKVTRRTRIAPVL